MAELEHLLVERHDAVATLTINRPDKLNALNAATRRDLLAALEMLRDDSRIRALILTGAGPKAFVAGADIGEFEGRQPIDQMRAMARLPVFEAVAAFPKPIVAAINGFCLGGGCELAMACDVRLASETARFGQPEIKLGIMPGGGGTQRLPRLIGAGAALKLLLTGELVDAAEALRLGLVEEVLAPDGLLPRARHLASVMAEKSPVALQLIKEAVRTSFTTPLDEGLRHERTLFGLIFSTNDKREGVEAFLAKRAPRFSGD